MKSQNTQQSLEHSFFSIQDSTKKCLSAKEATLFCYSKTCDRDGLICGEKSCECYQQHNKCPQLLIQSVMNTIKAKIIPLEDFKVFILDKIDKTIDQLSELKQKLQNQIRTNLNLYGLTNKDKILFNALEKQKITGKQLFKIFNQAINDDTKLVEKQYLDSKFASLWQSIDRQIERKFIQFQKILESIKNSQQLFGIRLLKDSKIKMAEQDEFNLIKMFGNKICKSANLLYRASQHNFEVGKFHEKCGNIPHTLTLCETVHGKVFGGYTPLVWDDPQKGKFLKDDTGLSFVFSLTNNHKFKLDKSKCAIQQNKIYGPIFGDASPDFFIMNYANINDSYTNINQSYFNQNYSAENGDSCMKFNGNPSRMTNYKAKQWQVWQLEFK